VTEAELAPAAARFRAEYGAHRAAEGRGHGAEEMLSLPYLAAGPLARQWAVRARSFEAFVRLVLQPASTESGGQVRLLDLGAGNGWLCHRAALAGHRGVALDVRDDAVDGLGAAGPLMDRAPGRIAPVAASFDALPLRPREFDVAVFNASLHYALDLAAVLAEAARVVRPGGRLVILDSPFYAREEQGEEMVAEKRREARDRFGDRADALLGLPFIEFLTRERLAGASAGLGLAWRRHRVLYPLWYEVRPLAARLRRRRPPSRFDLWQTKVP
jgi:SAM-dependent methyltransferase